MSYITESENRMPLLAFLLSFLVYVLTLCPTVFTGDSGELIASAYTLGVPHSPGYPLYCMLGKLFTFIPRGNIALRLNLMSAVFASGATVMVYLIITQLIKMLKPEASVTTKSLSALSASLIFAYSSTFWSQAVIAEIYTLFIFMCGLTTLLLLKWVYKKENRLLYWFCFLYGVTITCHQLGFFLGPAFFLIILFYQPKTFVKPKLLLAMFLFFVLGLSLYLYIPIRAFSNPVVNWNNIHSLGGFIGYLLRKQYGELNTNYNLSYFTNFVNFDIKHFEFFPSLLEAEFTVVWVCCFFGIITLVLKAKRLLLFFLSVFFMTAWKIWLVIPINAHGLYVGRVYLLPAYIFLAVLIGLGFFYLFELSLTSARKFFYYLTVFGISLLMVYPLVMNYKENDQSQNYVAYDFGMNILDTLDKNAIVFGHGDNTLFILAYLKFVEGLRPDVTVYDDIAGDIFKNTPRGLLNLDLKKEAKFLQYLYRKTKRPIYITFGNKLVGAISLRKDLIGVVYKVLRENEEIAPIIKAECWNNYRLDDIFDGNLENKDYLMREIIAAYHVTLGTAYLSTNEPEAIELLLKAAEIFKNEKFVNLTMAIRYSYLKMYAESISAAKRVVEIDPNDAESHFNLGVSYSRAKMYKEAIASWEQALKFNSSFPRARDYIKKAKKILSSQSKKKALTGKD